MAKQFKKSANKVQRVVKKAAPVKKVSKKTGRSGGRAVLATPKGEFIAAIGRRKTATARVRLYLTAGDYIVNDRPMAEHFNTLRDAEKLFTQPFKITDTLGRYSVSAKVEGSGSASQLDAVTMGIARALVKVDSDYKKVLRDAGFITRDPRMKESRKPGRGGKARAKRQSPKR